MFRERPHPASLAGAVAFSLITFAAGAATATVAAGDVARGEPIIKADAWDEQPPEMIVQAAFSEATMAQCSPWEVSDIAMEEILLEMQRRGWRAPNQGDAIDLLDPTGALSVVAIDPDAPMPRRYSGQSSIVIDESAEALPVADASLTVPDDTAPAMPTN